MTNVVPFQRPRRRPRRLFKRSSGRRWRWAGLIAIAAAAGWLPEASLSGGDGADRYAGSGHAHGIEIIGHFRGCTRARERNCVIDGDTVRISGDKIRLEDINAPETFGARCAAERRLGELAKLRLIELMNNGRLEVIDNGGRDEDSYGRKLRVIARAGRSVGDKLIDEGLARPWTGRRRSWCS